MKKRLFAGLMAAVMVVGFAGCTSSSSTTTTTTTPTESTGEETYTWKMSLVAAAGDNDSYDTGAAFAEKAAELSGGRINIQLYGGASLGTTSEVLEGLSYGVADLLCESVGTLATFTPTANIDAMPYIYSGYEHFMEVWGGEVGEAIKKQIGEETGFQLLGGAFRGPRIVVSSKEIRDLAGFTGFKLRAPNLEMYIKTWQWMGATPTPLAMTEVYTALQQGTVEGQENPMAFSMSYGFDEVCKYWIKTNHVYSCNVIILDGAMYDALPADIQEILVEAAAYASEKIGAAAIANDQAAEAELIANGCEVIEVDQDEFKAHFENFAEQNFPYLVEYVEQIKALDPTA